MNDFDIIEVNGQYHLIHLQGPPVHPFDATLFETSYGHAVSSDLVFWHPRAPVFGISSTPSFDDRAIWTMHVIRHNDRWWMFYTGLCHETYFLQQIGIAVTDREEPIGWLRYQRHPVVSASSQYYQTQKDMAWRDPFILYDRERQHWIMYVSAKVKRGSLQQRGCIGLATSSDLTHWEVHPPVLAPMAYREMECPVVYLIDDVYFMFVSVSDDYTVRAFRSMDPMGPFEYLGVLTQSHNYAPRLLLSPEKKNVLLHTVKRRWHRQDSNSTMRGMLAQPKQLVISNDGIPKLSWYCGLDKHFQVVEEELVRNGLLECSLTRQPCQVKIQLRVKGHGSGKTGIEVCVKKSEIRLRYIEDGKVLQSSPLPDMTSVRAIKVLMCDEFFEVYGNDILLLATTAYRHEEGRISVWVDEKNIDFILKKINTPSDLLRRDDQNAIF